MRTITYHFSEDDFDRVKVVLGTKLREAQQDPSKALIGMLGYFASWNLSYPVVDIYLRSTADAEFMAVFRKRPYEDGDGPDYVIGAIFDSEKFAYGFHS